MEPAVEGHALTVVERTSESAASIPADRASASERQGVAAEPQKAWELKELKQVHKDVASLFAQGMKNVQIAQLCDITPEYVHMLLKQPLVKAYIAEMCEVVGTRMEALFVKSVDVIADTLEHGTEAGKLKAVRLQLEATKRIGSGNGGGLVQPDTDRLVKLAERLIQLQTNVRTGRTFNQDGVEVQDG